MNFRTGTSSLLEVESLGSDDHFRDIGKLHIAHRPNIHAGQIILLEYQGKKARVQARGGCKNKLVIGGAAQSRLGIKGGDKVEIWISKGSLIDEWLWAWHATEAMTRISARLGVLSALLGFVGLFLGTISLL